MKSSTEHYDEHLGAIYSWMVGDIDAALARSTAELDALNLLPMTTGKAIDLGAGFGLHALPLARRGFSVLAIDSCNTLLRELCERADALPDVLPIRTVNADLLQFRAHADAPVDIILCMGDTLTHLSNKSSVESLFADVSESLVDGGLFIASFRDYASVSLQAEARFIPVRSDATRILTCFLEYAETTVTVHDLLHEFDGVQWRLRVSSYSKLRLAPEWVTEALSVRGFSVQREIMPGGMVRVVARLNRNGNALT